jgi:hypothetical protein
MWLLLLCALAIPALADIEIVGLPDELDDCYDLTWTVTVNGAPSKLFVLGIEWADKQGYHLRWEKNLLSWQRLGLQPAVEPVKIPLKSTPGMTTRFTVKRRADTVAVLQDHRLLLVAPAPARGKGECAFLHVPPEFDIDNARYQGVGKPVFGDDFMRTEVKPPTAQTPWVEDATWRVAYYRKDNPGADPRDPATEQPMGVPWQLSLFPDYVTTTSNGFWYLYQGVGPSWVVANPTMVYPFSDRYFVETAVKPEYDSKVGVIAAYQDNQNYLLFCWKQREFMQSNEPLAELIAVVNGEKKVLATSPRGFEPGQWYTLRINLGWQTVQALVDGELLMSAVNPGPVEGRVGLYADGAEKPRRPKLDEVTAVMYIMQDEETKKIVNDAAEAMRTSSIILFDDVRVGEWIAFSSTALDSPYMTTSTGRWKSFGEVSVNTAPGSFITGSPSFTDYTAATRVRLPDRRAAAAMLFNMDDGGAGYVWEITAAGQTLYTVDANARRREVDNSKLGLAPGNWADLRVEAHGPYVRLFFNNQRVLESYDATRVGGRCGLQSKVRDVAFQPLTVTQHEPPRKKQNIQDTFEADRWLSAWSSPEADWYPVVLPAKLVTPAGATFDQVGYAAPLPTNVPGLYWHKGGHFHDLRVAIPVSPETLKGQTLHLTTDYHDAGGYLLQLAAEEDGKYLARLARTGEPVGDYPFTLGKKSRLVFQRQGIYLLLTVQDLDPEDTNAEPEVLAERPVFVYRDRSPLKAEMIGFTVTDPALAAAKLQVHSDRLEDPFEYAPTSWIAESGVWAVMARYSCQPKWNWFGGFGAYTPTVWSKYRLDGDQVVEAYTGIKMQFDNQPEEYNRRYRDVNMTICADGSHLNSGYTLIRAGRPNGRDMVTLLLRKGVVVQQIPADPAKPTPAEQKFLLPPQGQGHRRWFATRMEKRGDTLKVFIDNLLAMTYQDPDPIPGGYAGIWTYNNGIMVGRANIAAEKMSLGSPRAAAPLAMQENLDPLPAPQVTVNNVPVKVATFENGLDDCKERPGLTARLVRERVEDPSGANTFLKVVNMYPAGDFSTTLAATPRDLRAAPLLHFDYCFDPGAKVNLYLRRQDKWYEFLLTGREAQEPNVVTAARLTAVADGRWHHFEADMGALLADVVARQTNGDAKTVDLNIQEMIVADWSASADARYYGFGNNVGGMAIRFDNIAFVPALASPLTLNWQLPGMTAPAWRTALDQTSMGAAITETAGAAIELNLKTGRYFYHLQAKDANGQWTPAVHIPLVVSAPDGK